MRKIKIYKAFPAYQNYLNGFHKCMTSDTSSSYIDIKNKLAYDGFPWILSWSSNIENKYFEIFETIHNDYYLQSAWNTTRVYSEHWQIEIVMEQIKEMQPNICVLYPPELFTDEIISEVRKQVAHDVLVVGYDGMNRMNIKLYKSFDIVITCSDFISQFYEKLGKETYTLNFCFDESILDRIKTETSSKYSVSFSGSIYERIHDGRYNLLKYLLSKSDVEIRSDFVSKKNFNLFSKSQIKRLFKEKDLANYLALWRIGKSNKGPVFGLDMYQFLHDSKISLNMHGDNIDFAANVRLYEATGVGTCLLTDWKKNIAELFVPDVEIVTYQTPEEAHDKIKYLLRNESVRKKIASAGQKRTLDNYTYKKVFPALMEYFSNKIRI